MIQSQTTSQSAYRWYILILSTLTNATAVAAPSMALSVLFPEISADLELTLVQVGMVWGIGALPGIVTGLLGGVIGDRFGPKRILIATYLLSGLAGILRGLSPGFGSLLITVSLFGALGPLAIMNAIKLCSLWFPQRQLGLANGVLSMGMAFGFLMGSLISAAWLSPWLGGWRHVLFFYGAIIIIMTIPWFFVRSAPDSFAQETETISMRRALVHVGRIRNLWLLGLVGLSVSGCIMGTLGYLPLYLRGLGWPEGSADGTLAFFHTVSMIFVLPIALWSDKLRSRKQVLVGAAILITTGVGLLANVTDMAVWLAVGMAGFVRDGFMAVFITMAVETEGIGSTYAGTATGFVMIFLGLGNLLAPALGNSLTTIDAGTPFLFWATLSAVGVCVLMLMREWGGETAVAHASANQ